MMNALIKWWESMGGWRWINGSLVLIAFVMSAVYGYTLVEWTDHGRRRLNDMDIHFDTQGALRAGGVSLVKIWIEEPTDLNLQINNEKVIPIKKASFANSNEYKFEVQLPNDLVNSIIIKVSPSDYSETANWEIGRLFR